MTASSDLARGVNPITKWDNPIGNLIVISEYLRISVIIKDGWYLELNFNHFRVPTYLQKGSFLTDK